MVLDELGPDRLPVWRGGDIAGPLPPANKYLTLTSDCAPPTGTKGKQMTYRPYFDEWFRDTPNNAVRIPVLLTLTETSNGSNVYVFDRTGGNMFFPATGQGWGADHFEGSSGNWLQNFDFSLQLHSEFRYAGTETFSFAGDDDVWVFINKKLVISLGGIHGQLSASVSLPAVAAAINLTVGERYWLDFFMLERHWSASNCRITTTIVPTNQPPLSTPLSFACKTGQNVTGSLAGFDPDDDALTFTPTLTADVAPYVTFGADGTSFTFAAPAALPEGAAWMLFFFSYVSSDYEFDSCPSAVLFNVSALPPPAPPPTPAGPPQSGLTQGAKVAIGVSSAIIALLIVAGIVLILLYMRSKMTDWEVEILAELNKESLVENPLYKPAEIVYENRMYEGKGAGLENAKPQD